MRSLLRSRKFLTAVFDLFVSVIIYFASRYAVSGLAEDAKFIIAAIQPVFMLVIAGIAYEDGQLKRGQGGVG